jgi:pimeloyl-ACP methyl ester carboxylesterase
MTRQLFILLFVVFMSLAIYGCTTHEWQKKDMNSRIGDFVEVDLKPGSPTCGLLAQCKFDLHYFKGDNYKEGDSDRKNILFIPGGPGEIVDRSLPDLGFLQKRNNVVYFDVRGTGLSEIPLSNAYDQFLRAEYIVSDIETLRKRVLDNDDPEIDKPWDAIYAYSWGTIVAQRYAAKYPLRVKKLILAAPVSRTHGDTETARRQMLVKNLLDILRKHQTQYACPWHRDHPLVKEPPQGFYPEGTDNFCFVNEGQMATIRHEFITILNELESDYGSVTFVESFYKRLKSSDNAFKYKYPYPEEFFSAIGLLGFLGGAEQQPLRFDSETMRLKISAAFFLGNYLMLGKSILRDETNVLNPFRPVDPSDPDQAFMNVVTAYCHPENPFFKSIPSFNEKDNLRRNFCQRLMGAQKDLTPIRRNNRSNRARSVFGVYDGLTRWVFRVLEQEQRLDDQKCFRGKDLLDVARGDLETDLKTNTVIREEAGKLGISRFEIVCPWDPAVYRHKRRTLILAGSADAVIAGGQAEYFFQNSLTPGQRVLIEFPGAGHSMHLQMTASALQDLATAGPVGAGIRGLVDAFLRMEIADFMQDEDIQTQIKSLKACGIGEMTIGLKTVPWSDLFRDCKANEQTKEFGDYTSK